jgi:hypothetical protein
MAGTTAATRAGFGGRRTAVNRRKQRKRREKDRFSAASACSRARRIVAARHSSRNGTADIADDPDQRGGGFLIQGIRAICGEKRLESDGRLLRY